MRVNHACLFAIGVLALAVCAESAKVSHGKNSRVDFMRDIRPILVDKCYTCHGPDVETREADLRLDTRAELFVRRSSDHVLVVPGDRAASHLYERISSTDHSSQMPPPDSDVQLTPEQIERVGRWIDEGAAWDEHWAYEAPQRPPLPNTKRTVWGGNAIDAFAYDQMESHGLRPSDEADRRTLLRRVTLDLTGLPPTIAEVNAFLVDTNPGAYERVVDRLLHSPRFGERMATPWLDLARYADTHGYHMDAHRDMWRWRDWVIAAYNDNMPFDQFTIEQLAGDQLPHATLSQRIATGFNRNNMVNFENGAIADEYLTEYAIDRVTTTSTVWLGQTMTCARCHDHKYDPFTQRDFYRLLAFFNQVSENGIDGNKGNVVPFIDAPLPHQVARLDNLAARLSSLTQLQQQRVASADAAIAAWEANLEASDTRSISHKPQISIGFDKSEQELQAAIHGSQFFAPGKLGDALLFNRKTFVDLGDQAALGINELLTIAVYVFPTTTDSAIVVQRHTTGANDRSYGVELDGGKVIIRLASFDATNDTLFTSDGVLASRNWHHLAVRVDTSDEETKVSLFVNGELQPTVETAESHSRETVAKPVLVVGSSEPGRSFRGMMDDLRVYSTALADEEIAIIAGGDPIGDIVAVNRAERTEQQISRLKRYFLEQIDKTYRATMREIETTRLALADLRAAIPTTMVMQDAAERKPTYVLTRGRYDALGEVVEPGVPVILSTTSRGAVATRLGFARWLVDPKHPLTARVAVNHLWQQFFGAGLVRTPEDFGTRGELPTHPQLLDWLATEFARDWDVKRLVRLLLTSATYRQSSRTTPERSATDPENRWLARASRLRLTGEAIRDSALFSSDLLVEQTGGRSVFPYQPDGLWEEIAYNANDFTAQAYRQSHDADLYRRSLYTFVKRSLPSPTLAAFDTPNRETCTARRSRTNTPQQALTLMNDMTFVEAARAFAERTLATVDSNAEWINHMFVTATSRLPNEREAKVFSELVRDLREEYDRDPMLANELIKAGESKHDDRWEPSELAIWTAVANVILSLDEAITRP